jgi:phosphatidate cytidylyltransferase
MRNKKRMTNEIEKKLETHIKKRYKSETSESGIEEPILEKKTIASKASNFKVRVISSLIMVAAFIAILVAGHFYCCLLVIFINICIFKEIIALKRNEQREAKLPYFSIINWYFFGMTEVILTSLFISHKMVKSHTIDVRYK